MKAFIAAVIAGAAISVGAWVLLGDLGFSSAERLASQDVRLGD